MIAVPALCSVALSGLLLYLAFAGGLHPSLWSVTPSGLLLPTAKSSTKGLYARLKESKNPWQECLSGIFLVFC